MTKTGKAWTAGGLFILFLMIFIPLFLFLVLGYASCGMVELQYDGGNLPQGASLFGADSGGTPATDIRNLSTKETNVASGGDADQSSNSGCSDGK